MTCAELQAVLPDIMGGVRSAEQEAHLHSCSACTTLVAELNWISQQARQLQASEEPSPRVWNSIEMALRNQGLARQPQREPFLSPARSPRWWNLAWLAPVAAVIVLAFGVRMYQGGQSRKQSGASPATGELAQKFDVNDQQLLSAVALRAPSQRDSYEADLSKVNEFVRDAEESAKANPNDEDAQEFVMQAYDQKAMVYEMALDRSLP